jgi:micrococcal nuclease
MKWTAVVFMVMITGCVDAERDSQPEPRVDCDPAYPDFCIPPYPPDLDCDDIGATNFSVYADDPHGFDGYDNDGLGCES